MGGDEANPLLFEPTTQPPISADGHRRAAGRPRLHHFPEGSTVEVNTNEEDFKGVYFSATVLRKSGRKSRKLLVEYQNLLAHEDGSDRLTEMVDVACVRPVPPSPKVVKGFEPDDVVDAFYKDGWWTGTVNRVTGDGERFVVLFNNPPDELEFGINELREHWDWVNGSWVRPQRQSIAGLMFDVGRKVEVSFDREDFQDAWFPATINEDLGNGTFMVERIGVNTENHGPTKVDSLHIRPCPPLLKDKNFVLLEKVDAFFDSGWWSGIITKELEHCRYLVFFKQMKCEKEFGQSELRPHMEWKDGKWFTSAQEPSNPSQDDGVCQHHTPENSSASAATATVSNSLNDEDTCGEQTHSSLITTNGHLELFIPNNQKLPHVTTSLTKRRESLSDSGGTLSQPHKKPREGNLVGANKKDGHDGPNKFILCGFESPESFSNMDTLAQTTLDMSSTYHTWEENVQRKQRNIRTAQNASDNIKSTSSSLEKSAAQILPLQSLEFDFGEKEPYAAENTEEGAQNEHAKRETKLPIVMGLPCPKIGRAGISGSNRSQSFKKKVLLSEFNVDDQRHEAHNFTIQKIKDCKQSGIGEVSERRKRGRPKKILVEGTKTPATGNAEYRGHSFDLNKTDDDSQRFHEVVAIGMEASISCQETTMPNQETTMLNQEMAPPNQVTMAPNQQKTAPNQQKTLPNKEKTAPNQQKTARNQEKTTPNQEKTMPNQEKTTRNQEKTTLNLEKTVPSQQKTAPNQQKTARNQEKTAPNQVKMTLNLEKTTPSQEKTMRNQERMTPNLEKTTLCPEKTTRNQAKTTPNLEKTMSSQETVKRNQEKMKLNQEKTQPNQEKMKLNQEKTQPNQEKTTSNQDKIANEKIANGLSNPRKRKVRMPKRILASNNEEAGVEESVSLGENSSLKKGRWQITNGRIPVKVRDVDGESGGKATVANSAVDVEKVIEPSNEFDNEPLSKWIEELHVSSVTDGSRLLPVETVGQCIVNSDNQGTRVVRDEASEKHLESERQSSGLVDKAPTEPQSLPSENDTARVVLDEDTQNRSLSGTQTAPLVDKDPIKVSEPRSLPSVEAYLDWGRKKRPENKARANALVDASPMIPSQPQSSVKKTVGVLLNEDNEKRPENGTTVAPALVDKVAIAPSGPEKLPFVKNTVLWKTIEAMEVFQRLPQKPHFQPLENFKESSREGLAIGYMVTFSSLVERASKLQLNDPVSITDDMKETLTDLEKHGFDVRSIQDRINELVTMKDKEEKLANNAQTLNSQITEHSQAKTKIETEIDEINGHIRRLQMKLAQVESEKEKEDEEIAFLQVRLRETQDSIETLENDFKGIVSSIL